MQEFWNFNTTYTVQPVQVHQLYESILVKIVIIIFNNEPNNDTGKCLADAAVNGFLQFARTDD